MRRQLERNGRLGMPCPFERVSCELDSSLGWAEEAASSATASRREAADFGSQLVPLLFDEVFEPRFAMVEGYPRQGRGGYADQEERRGHAEDKPGIDAHTGSLLDMAHSDGFLLSRE